MAEKSSGSVFENVQVLRAVAAYMVVCHHVLNNLAHYTAVGRFAEMPGIGARGVEIFFVISGFIMVSTTDAREQRPGRFLLHRIVRIVPIYWLLTFVAALAIASGLQLFNRGALSLDMLLTSLLFLPDLKGVGEATKPLVVVGWTLNYEMMFYAIFALCLFFARSLRIWLACGAVLLLWLAQMAGIGGLLGYWGDDIVLSFVLGMAIARLTPGNPLPVWPALAAIALGGAALVVLEIVLVPSGFPRPGLVSALAAGAIVLGAVSLDRRGASIMAPWLKGQGNASYSIYLLHPFILQFVGKAWLVTHLNRSAVGLVVMVVVMFTLVCVLGTAFHRLVEVPLTAALRQRVDMRRRRTKTMADSSVSGQAFENG